MHKEIVIKDREGLEAAAREFVDAAGDRRIFAFRAPMGAGKTTFISAVCKVLGMEEEANSPTFSIINEYRSAGGETVYHFDFYRVEDIEEALDMGIDDYFYSGAWCFIEWPEMIGDLLPEEAAEVRIEVGPDGERTLKF